MRRGNVQRLEVVPLVFDFRPVGHREAEPTHDVFQFFDRLRERMQMPERERDAGLSNSRPPGNVGSNGSPVSAAALPESRSCAAASAASSATFTSLNRLPAAGLSGPGTPPKPFLHGFQPAALRTEKFHPRRFNRRRIAGAFKRRHTIGGQAI